MCIKIYDKGMLLCRGHYLIELYVHNAQRNKVLSSKVNESDKKF